MSPSARPRPRRLSATSCGPGSAGTATRPAPWPASTQDRADPGPVRRARDFKRSQVDLATARGGSGFQPGSSFKVFFLVAALEKGISPGKVYNSPARITIPDRRCYTGYNTPWTLGNAGDGEAGVFNMYQATAHSVNTYFAQLAMDVGIERGIEAARRMGISVPPRGSKDYDDHWNVCSSVLGVVPVSVLDMASAYGVLANNGVRCPAFSIARINGPTKKLFERRPDCRQGPSSPRSPARSRPCSVGW